MINNTPESSRLDDTVKETLTNFEASFDANDWAKMESMLDAAPKPSNFKWSTVIAGAAVIVVIGGSYLLYNSLSSSKSDVNSEVKAPVENVVKVIAKPVEAPKVIPPSIDPAAVSKQVTKEIVEPVKIISSKEPEKKIVTNPVVAAKEDKTKTKKEKNIVVKAEETVTHQQVIGMGNEPVFGDMLDSSRGIVGETREKEETRKAAKANKDLPVGWDNFMLKNVNPDSLKKYREKRDSLKRK